MSIGDRVPVLIVLTGYGRALGREHVTGKYTGSYNGVSAMAGKILRALTQN